MLAMHILIMILYFLYEHLHYEISNKHVVALCITQF
jgi:hypothetical protein